MWGTILSTGYSQTCSPMKDALTTRSVARFLTTPSHKRVHKSAVCRFVGIASFELIGCLLALLSFTVFWHLMCNVHTEWREDSLARFGLAAVTSEHFTKVISKDCLLQHNRSYLPHIEQQLVHYHSMALRLSELARE